MTNAQRAGARRAFNRFEGIEPSIVGDTIVPRRISDGETGSPVSVTESMSANEVERAVQQSCTALNG